MFKDKLTFWRHREAMLDVINNIAAQNRFGNTRANSTANIRTDFMAIFQIFIFQNIAAVRLNKDQVSIFAGSNTSFMFQTKISAALVAINLPNIGNDIPRFCTASSNMTSMQFCSPAIPPHACMILPAFISGGHGEWSDTRQSISPLNSFPTSLSGFPGRELAENILPGCQSLRTDRYRGQNSAGTIHR